MWVGGQSHALAALTLGKRHAIHRTVGWVGCKAGAENLAHSGIGSPDRPARSQ
jgi:hypothetical protein